MTTIIESPPSTKEERNHECQSTISDEPVPGDHFAQRIGPVLDPREIRRQLISEYSAIGRPPINRDRMIRMLIVGNCHGTSPEHRLDALVHLNVAYRRICRLYLEDRVRAHLTFSLKRLCQVRVGDSYRLAVESVGFVAFR